MSTRTCRRSMYSSNTLQQVVVTTMRPTFVAYFAAFPFVDQYTIRPVRGSPPWRRRVWLACDLLSTLSGRVWWSCGLPVDGKRWSWLAPTPRVNLVRSKSRFEVTTSGERGVHPPFSKRVGALILCTLYSVSTCSPFDHLPTPRPPSCVSCT